MAYTASIWNAAQYKLSEMMAKPEFKFKPSAALLVFLKNTNMLVPASERERLWNQKPSDQTVVSTYALSKQTVALGAAREAAHSGAIGASTTANVTYTTYSRKFKYSIKQGDRNVFGSC